MQQQILVQRAYSLWNVRQLAPEFVRLGGRIDDLIEIWMCIKTIICTLLWQYLWTLLAIYSLDKHVTMYEHEMILWYVSVVGECLMSQDFIEKVVPSFHDFKNSLTSLFLPHMVNNLAHLTTSTSSLPLPYFNTTRNLFCLRQLRNYSQLINLQLVYHRSLVDSLYLLVSSTTISLRVCLIKRQWVREVCSENLTGYLLISASPYIFCIAY